MADAVWVCWSVAQMVRTTDREGGPVHIQGENERTLCGIPYRAEWDFEIHEDASSVTCRRCREILDKRATRAAAGAALPPEQS